MKILGRRSKIQAEWGFSGVCRLLPIPRNRLKRLVAGGGFELHCHIQPT